VDTPNQLSPSIGPWGEKYRKSRPLYPPELFQFLASIAPQCVFAWDCGTGNGQAAVGAAQFFENVVATDNSIEQIALAIPNERVQYFVRSAERANFEPESLDLIMVAQALHWFDINSFFRRTPTFLKRGGILAVFCYDKFELGEQFASIIDHFHSEVIVPNLHPNWDRINLVKLPISEIEAPVFSVVVKWDCFAFTNYISSRRSVMEFIEHNGKQAFDRIYKELMLAWGSEEFIRTIQWPLKLRVGKKLDS
jgi:SAM-dependent methyltransferase